MSDDNNLPNTDKFFDIKPSSKRLVSPNSRSIIVDNSPAQSDSMINEEPIVDVPAMQDQSTESLPETTEETTDNTEVVVAEEQEQAQEPGQTIMPEQIEEPEPTEVAEEIAQDDKTEEAEEEPRVEITDDSNNQENQVPEVVATDDTPDAVIPKDELLLPVHATPDQEPSENKPIVTESKLKKPFWKKTWFIIVIIVVILALIGGVVYKYVYKSTNYPSQSIYL